MKSAFPTGTIKRGEPGGVICRPEEDTGMELRDYFAAKAMQAFLTRKNFGFEDVSRWSFIMADHMMKAREAK